jgi:hypothetical protein
VDVLVHDMDVVQIMSLQRLMQKEAIVFNFQFIFFVKKILFKYYIMYSNSLPLLKTLYYRVTLSNTSNESNAAIIDYLPYVDKESSYSGLQNRFMMDVNGVPNKDVICFIGYRTPATDLEQYTIYSLYNETLTIQTPNGLISALAIYNDGGTGFITEVPFIEYAVSSASGEFVGSKIVTIFFNNINKTRIVEIYG